MTCFSSGGAGDIVYSIPVMQALCVDTYHVTNGMYSPPNIDLFHTLQPLLLSQGLACYIGNSGDVNVDNFRLQHVRGSRHIILTMCAQFGVQLPDWSAPWLTGIKPLASFKNLIHVTPRWRERSFVKWEPIVAKLRDCAFIGLPDEYEAFCIESKRQIPYLQTDNLLQFAQLIAGCDALHCNQSVGLAIAQGLGKKYYLQPKPNKQNCLMCTKNENILR